MRFARHAAALAWALAATALHAQGMRLESPDMSSGKALPDKFAFSGFGCTGEREENYYDDCDSNKPAKSKFSEEEKKDDCDTSSN